MAPTIVLVSGANRGLGKGFVQRYLETPSHTVIAANRNPEHPSSEELANLPKASGSSLIVVKVDASSDTDALDAARELQKQGIDHLDVVIANAAIAEGFPRVEDTSAEGLLRHVNINTCGVLRLYQATIPLLRRAASPKFATISSLGGSIEDLLPFPNGMYGPTKAAVNWLTKKINAEEENLAAFALSPGFARTDMGEFCAAENGIDHPPLSVYESCDGQYKLINEATKETSGGKFFEYDGTTIAW